MDSIHTTDREDAQAPAAAALQRAAAIMARLRAPDGCPWDREQTFDSIKRYTLEETYEVFDAIERRAWPDLKDELGDLFLQVLFYAQMAAEAGYFDLRDVAESLSAKLIRRHPHVFADAVAADPDEVLRNWEQIKTEENKTSPASTPAPISLLDGIPRIMPATLEATKLGSRAAKTGFDWPSADGIFEKLAEEAAELQAEIAHADTGKMEAEFGDLFFTMMNLARHLKIDPESALRGSNARFRARFAAMERMGGGAAQLRAMSAEDLDRLWSKAKRTLYQEAESSPQEAQPGTSPEETRE